MYEDGALVPLENSTQRGAFAGPRQKVANFAGLLTSSVHCITLTPSKEGKASQCRFLLIWPTITTASTLLSCGIKAFKLTEISMVRPEARYLSTLSIIFGLS
jgi:hypothetical protein